MSSVAIDLNETPDIPPYEVYAALARHEKVRTQRDAPDTVPDHTVVIDGKVCLTRGDEGCAECGSLIEAADFAPNAPVFSIIANQLLNYPETYCETHLKEVQSQ